MPAGLAELDRMLRGTRPGKATPLAESLDFINRRIQSYAPALQQASKMMFVVVVTDGVPTPLVWDPRRPHQVQLREASDRAISELYKIVGRFPASLVVRLCTNDDDAVNFWNNLDDTEEVIARGACTILQSPPHVLRTLCSSSDAICEQQLPVCSAIHCTVFLVPR